MPHTQTILGIPFFCGTLQEAISIAKYGGLITFPSGPGLSELDKHPDYTQSLMESDLVCPDSGLLCLLTYFLAGKKLLRISGYRFLKVFLKDNAIISSQKTFWVMPSEYQMQKNLEWLNTQGFNLQEEDCYISPKYNQSGKIEDSQLLSIIENKKPLYIIICLGGGIQEKLGYYLRKNLSFKPTILCTGAAIAFLSGIQASIPLWADDWYLGWLLRIIQSPRSFFMRYLRAFRLISLVTTYPKK